MKSRPTLHEQLARKCKHFNGTQNTKCEAGVAYMEVRRTYEGESGADFPCLRGDARWPQHQDKPQPPCDKRRWPTEEEIAAEEEEARQAIEQLTNRLKNDLCVVCGQKLSNKRQVGRCVYGDPCGHRQYQGRLGK